MDSFLHCKTNFNPIHLDACQKLNGTIPSELGNLGKNTTLEILDGRITQLPGLNFGKSLLFLIFRVFIHELRYF